MMISLSVINGRPAMSLNACVTEKYPYNPLLLIIFVSAWSWQLMCQLMGINKLITYFYYKLRSLNHM